MQGTSISANNKVLLAALAGASAGIIAGLLMAPDTGRGTRENLKRMLGNLGLDADNLMRTGMDKLGSMGTDASAMLNTGKEKLATLAESGVGLQLKGNWNELKGKLKQKYAQLTDEDLNYTEGNADEMVGNLQRKLGKTDTEVKQMLNDL